MTTKDDQLNVIVRLEQVVSSLSSHLVIAEEYGARDFASQISLESSRHELKIAEDKLRDARSVLRMLELNDDLHVHVNHERDPHGPVPISHLGKLLFHFQTFANAVQQASVGLATPRGQVQRQVALDACLYAVGSMEGSYGVRMRVAPPDGAELAGQYGLDLPVILSDFFDASRFDRDRVIDLCRQSTRTFAAYREILSLISKSRMTVAVSARGRHFSVQMSSSQASEREADLLLLETAERDFTTTGVLVGASMLKDTFELQTSEGVLRGRVRHGIAELVVDKSLFGKTVIATLSETIEKQAEGLSEPVARYELVHVELPGTTGSTLFDQPENVT